MSARNLANAEADDDMPQAVQPMLEDEEAVVTRTSRTLNMELTCPVCLVSS